ncbi:MAG: B12-binding domain-containing radical SAM protein [Chloroflexi bacterium]|nr:B12-binding domain-containing radical SAM protein [Chloroflexota bacterium]
MKRSGKEDTGVAFFISHFMGVEKFSYSMGTAYMAAYLKSKGIPSLSVSGGSGELHSFLQEIKKRGVRVLGIPAYDLVFSNVKAAAQEARRSIPDLLIVTGGPTATFGEEIILNNIPDIDVAVRSEGEEAIFELYRYSEGAGSLEDIRGISFREGGRILRTPDRELIGIDAPRGEELDVLPSPFEQGILTGLEANPGLMTSRGCVYPCTFCCGPAMFKNRVRYHSIDRVIRDLKIIDENLGARKELQRIDFWDDNLCLDRERTRRLCEAIIKEGLKFHFHTQIRADRLDRDLLELLHEAGLKGFNFGLESAVPRVLRNIKKAGGTSPDLREEKEYVNAIKRAIKDCKELGITATVSVIFGLPGETYEEGMTTIRTVEELNLETYYHNNFIVFVGSEIHRNHEKFGMKVRHGERVLPLKCTHNYDVNSIPILPNAYPMDYSIYFVHSFENALFEWWDINHPYFNIFRPHILIEDHKTVDESLLEWLKQNLSFFSQMIFRYDEITPSLDDMKVIKKKFVENLLSRSFMVLEKTHDKNSRGVEHYRLETDLLEEFPLYCPSDYYRYPFHRWRSSRRTSTSERIVFYDVLSRKDAEYFLSAMSDPPADFENSVIGRMIRGNIPLATACRFTGRLCPALNLQKIHVRKNGELSPCEHGCCIGHVGDSLEDLKQRVEKLTRQEEKKRGCNKCRVRAHCTRCIFTAPFTAEEYCSFMRQAGWYPRMLQFLLMCYNKWYKNNFIGSLRKGEILKGSARKDAAGPLISDGIMNFESGEQSW